VAAPVYATNLVDITTAEGTTGFTAIGGGGAIAYQETDFFIQGSFCLSKATANTWDSAGTARGGALFNNGAGITVPTDGAVLTWIYWWGPGVLATKANGGAEISIGNSTTAYRGWYVTGSDDWAFGGWRCYPVDPSLTPDRTVGSPTATRQYFGWVANVAATVAIARGNPYGIDAIRYGRCDIVSTNGDLANGYATFLGAADWDNNITRRYGMLTPRDGAYFHQGLFQMGTDATAVDFRDSNRVVFIQNTEKVSANFNRYEVRNASSRVDWTNIGISALGTVSKGRFEAVANADINIDTCTFTDMDSFIFQSNSTIVATTFRRCGLITQGSAIFNGGNRITNATGAVAMLANNIDNISATEFISDGTGHAIELTSAHAGNSYTLTDVNFTGYASTDGSTGNEAIYNNSGGAVTINISGGNTPSIRNGAGATTTVVAGAVTVTLTVTTATGTAIQDANSLLYATAGGPFPAAASVTITNSGTTATVTHTSHGLASNDKVLIKGASLPANRGVFSITVTGANTYTYTMASAPGSNPTGTITSTFVLLSGLTNAQGQLTMSRVFPSDQPVAGWSRKSSGTPYYKTGPVSGTVDSGTGATLTALLIADE
jgi:hypothetical protein